MASDVSSTGTEINVFFDDEKEEGEISLEDVSSSEEGQLYKYPPRTYQGQCPYCLSTQHCATWCRSLTVNKVNNKRDGGVQGKENRRNRYYDKEPAGVSNVHTKHAGLYSTLQEKNDAEAQNDLVPISSDSDMELVGLESAKKEKKHRKLHKKRRKKSPLSADISLALSIKESIHKVNTGLSKIDAGLKSSHSRTRYSPDKKSTLKLQRRHSRFSPLMRPRRPRSPPIRKLSPKRQRKPPPQTVPLVTNEEVNPLQESPSSRGSFNELLKIVKNLDPSKEKSSSLKEKLNNFINSEKKDSSVEETSCKESKPTEKDKKTEKDVEKEKTKGTDREREKGKDRDKEKTKQRTKVKEKERDKEKGKEKERGKEKESAKNKAKVKEKGKVKEKKIKGKEKNKEKEKEEIKKKEKVKDQVTDNIKIKEEKEDEFKSSEENCKDDDDLVVLRQVALETKRKNAILSPDQIKIEPVDDEDLEVQENEFKMPNFCMDDNDEDLQLRMIALRSAVIKKHRTRMQFGLKRKQTKNLQQEEHRQSMMPRMESPFTASFIDDFPLLAEICSPSSPLSKKDSLSVEDMVLDSDMELAAISDDESPYSPSDDIGLSIDEAVDSSLYTPSKPTGTPCPRSDDKSAMNDMSGSILEFVNQESRPYSPTDVTIYDPDLPGVHSNSDPTPVLALTPPQMQHPPPLHATPPLQPPPLPPLSMFAAPVPVPEPMVLGCPPNMLNPFVDPTMANFSVNPMLMPPPQLFTPFPPMPVPAPTAHLPSSVNQLDDFGETDLDGSPLVPIEKDGREQQQWRLLNEPLYLQDLPPLGETHMNKVPLIPTPNLVPTAVLKSNKQLQRQPAGKSPARDSLFRNAEMTPVMLESDVSKPCALFKPMKLQPSTKKNVPLQPAAAFNLTAEDADSPRASQCTTGRGADTPVERPRSRRKSVTPAPSESKRKRKRQERRARRASIKERLRASEERKTVSKSDSKIVSSTTSKPIRKTASKTEKSNKDQDKQRRGSVEDDEEEVVLREILLASLAKRAKEHHPDKAPSAAEPTTGANAKIVESDLKVTTAIVADTVEMPKTDVSSSHATKQSATSKSNATVKPISISTPNLLPVAKSTASSVATTTTKISMAVTSNPTEPTPSTTSPETTSLEAAPSTSTIEATPSTSTMEATPATSSMEVTPSTSLVAATSKSTTNNLKRTATAMSDSEPSNKIARKAASAKVVNNAKRYQNLLHQRKMAQQKNSTATMLQSRFKVNRNDSLTHRSNSPNIAKLESNRLIINLNEDTDSDQDMEQAKLSPTKERPQLSIPETEFEMSLNQFLKSAREQHEIAAATSTVAPTVEEPEIPTASEETASPSSLETPATTSEVTLTVTIRTCSPSKMSDALTTTTSSTVPSTSTSGESSASISEAIDRSITMAKVSTSATLTKVSTVTTAPVAKTSITTATKTSTSTTPANVSAAQPATTVKLATNTVSKIDSPPKIIKTSAKITTDPALTPLAVKHLPASRQEEYRRLKQKIYEMERQKLLKAKESGSLSTATHPTLKKSINNAPTSTATPTPSLKSPPSLTSLALASSTPKATSKSPTATTSETLITATASPIVAVSTPSVTTVSTTSDTTVCKPSIATASTAPNTAVSKTPLTTTSSSSVVSAPVNAATVTKTPSISVTSIKSLPVNAEKSAAIATNSTSKPMPALVKLTPKSQPVATISPMAKPSFAESMLSSMSPIVLITPTKIVHSTASSLVKSVPNKTASVSYLAASRNTITSNLKAANSSPRILPQSTQESPTKLLDKMNAALKNQTLQISAVEHKVSSLRILTKEQINQKSLPSSQPAPSTSSALNLNLNRINKEATTSNGSATKVVVENPPAGTSNDLKKTSSTEVSSMLPSTTGAPATADSSQQTWDDFKHKVNNEVQSLTDLTTEEQRNLLRDTEERLINKRHLVLDDITEMSSNLRQWEIERDLQSMLSAEVKKLREQLMLAEERMRLQKEKLNSIQPKVSSYHEKINSGRKECFRLSKICSSLGQKVNGPSYKVPTAGAELLNNRIKDVANHTQKLKSRKSQSSGTLNSNNSQKTDKTKLKDNSKLNNVINLKSNELNRRQNNFNITGASLPNNNNVNTNSIAKNLGIVKNKESSTVSKYVNRNIKEEIIYTDESSGEYVSADSFNNDVNEHSRETNLNNSLLNQQNNRTDKPLNNATVSNANLTTERLNSNSNNGELPTISISNNRSENCFSSENENLSQTPVIASILNTNEPVNAVIEKENTESNLENEISSRENFNKTISDEQSTSLDVVNNVVESENVNRESANTVENPQSQIVNQNSPHIDNNISNVDNINDASENSVETSSQIQQNENESSSEQSAPTDSIVDSAFINDESNKNSKDESADTTSVLDIVEHTQQKELCLETNRNNINTIIEKIKSEPEMEIDSDADSVLQTTVPQPGSVENNNNTDDVEEFSFSKLNVKTKEESEEIENYQNEFPDVSTSTEHYTLQEEINLLEIANAVEVPNTLTRYSQLFNKKKKTRKTWKTPLGKAENVKEDSKKKKVPRPYESILKHLNAPRNYKTDGILCPYELMGTCYDGDCQYIHQSTSHS